MPSFWRTADKDSSHSLVSVGSRSLPSDIISIFLVGFFFSWLIVCVSTGFSCSTLWDFSASTIIFSVSLGISKFLTSFFSGSGFFSEADWISTSLSPFDTLSPTFTKIFETSPSSVLGTSTLDLSLSRVTIESFFWIFWPSFTRTSMTVSYTHLTLPTTGSV